MNSFLAFFGYPRGVDQELNQDINIESFFNSVYNIYYNNLYTYLMDMMTLENNIFGYEVVNKINLVSIPDEIRFYNLSYFENTSEYVKDEEYLTDGSFFGKEHVLEGNTDILKENKIYYLDYQYVVKEPDYYETYHNQIYESDYLYDAESEFNNNRGTYYGRTNRLSFRLCYEYCETCYDLGSSIINQKCETCLDQYSYDYWAYSGTETGNCVPQNYYFDRENTNMLYCNYADPHFKTITDPDSNKQYCYYDPNVVVPTIPKKEPSTIINDEPITPPEPIDPTNCNFESYLKKQCQIPDIIIEYLNSNTVVSQQLSTGTIIEVTNDKEDKSFNKKNKLPWLFLGKCGEMLRSDNSIDEEKPLIILKHGRVSKKVYENYFEFEVYHPDTQEKLDLSICEDIPVETYIDSKITDEFANSVNSVIDQGYNPYDINDKFYREICTPYDSPDGTDVLLDDREEYFYSSLNTIACPDGCGNSSYSLDTKYLKCDCPVKNEDITLDLKHISGDNVVKSFKSTLTNSNWKVMICYNLVFDKDVFGKNAGSILTLILFIVYIGFFVYYIMEGITPLQENIAQIMSDEEEEKKEEAKSKENNEKKDEDKEKKPDVITFKNPPKKSKLEKDSNGSIIIRKSNDIKIVALKSDKGNKLMTSPGLTEKDLSKLSIKKELIHSEGVNFYEKKKTEINEVEEKNQKLDDFQLNNLEYLDACKYDKRSFLKTYWSVLKREHIIIYLLLSLEMIIIYFMSK